MELVIALFASAALIGGVVFGLLNKRRAATLFGNAPFRSFDDQDGNG